jgi:hypothetical protein
MALSEQNDLNNTRTPENSQNFLEKTNARLRDSQPICRFAEIS